MKIVLNSFFKFLGNGPSYDKRAEDRFIKTKKRRFIKTKKKGAKFIKSIDLSQLQFKNR